MLQFIIVFGIVIFSVLYFGFLGVMIDEGTSTVIENDYFDKMRKFNRNIKQSDFSASKYDW